MTYYTCSVCAFSEMPYPPTRGNICPCCGTEFGYDDDFGVTFLELRNRWVATGTPWFSPVDEPPPMWDGLTQLILGGLDFDWPFGADQDDEIMASISGLDPSAANAEYSLAA